MQVVECFGETITKKNPIFCPKMAKKTNFFGFKQCFWGLSGQLWGLPPYLQGAGLSETCFARFWSRLLSFSEPPSPKKNAFFAQKMAKKKTFFGLKQCFWDLSGHL